jgi:carbon-monoxide dehydrogenase medium subunit
MIAFEYVEPEGLEEALAVLEQHGEDAKVLAGGTGLVNLMKQRLVQPAYLIGLRQLARVPELAEIRPNGGLTIGALCSHRTIETSALIQHRLPLLATTFQHVASVRIRAAATIGGSLAHADPNQDPPPALLVLDARVRVQSRHGAREIALSDFFVDYYETALEPEELITTVVIPPQPAGTGTAFLKFLPQTHDDYATIAVAALVSLDGDTIARARIALGAAAATPLRARTVETALQGQAPTAKLIHDAAALVAEEIDPLADFRGSAEYKRAMAVVFTQRAIEQAVTQARGASGNG